MREVLIFLQKRKKLALCLNTANLCIRSCEYHTETYESDDGDSTTNTLLMHSGLTKRALKEEILKPR